MLFLFPVRLLLCLSFMKTILPLFDLLVSLNLQGQVKFEKDEWNKLLAKAGKEKRLVFVDAYTDWCGWCKVMDRNTFSDSTVGVYMGQHFVSTKIEMEKEEIGRSLASQHGVHGYPSFLIFDSTGKLLYRMEGYLDPKNFMAQLKEIMTRINP